MRHINKVTKVIRLCVRQIKLKTKYSTVYILKK